VGLCRKEKRIRREREGGVKAPLKRKDCMMGKELRNRLVYAVRKKEDIFKSDEKKIPRRGGGM